MLELCVSALSCVLLHESYLFSSCIKQVLKYWKMHHAWCYFKIKRRSFVADEVDALIVKWKTMSLHCCAFQNVFHCWTTCAHFFHFFFFSSFSSVFFSTFIIKSLPKVRWTLQISSPLCLFYHWRAVCVLICLHYIECSSSLSSTINRPLNKHSSRINDRVDDFLNAICAL